MRCPELNPGWVRTRQMSHMPYHFSNLLKLNFCLMLEFHTIYIIYWSRFFGRWNSVFVILKYDVPESNAKSLNSSVAHQSMSLLNGCFTQQGPLQPSVPDCRPNPRSIWHLGNWKRTVLRSLSLREAFPFHFQCFFFLTLIWSFQKPKITSELKSHSLSK